MNVAIAAPEVVAAEPHVRQLGRRRQLLYYSQFLYRYVFALLLFSYMRHEGIAGGFLGQHHIAAAMVAYVLIVAAIMAAARGRRLSPPLQRALVALDLTAFMIGVPHDPHPGLPTLFVFYLAFADLGLRYRFDLYVQALAMGFVALAAMVFLRRTLIDTGMSAADWWTVFLVVVIVLHGLQVFSGRDKARRVVQQAQERLQLALQSPGLGAWSTDDPLAELKVDGHIQQVLGMEPGRFSERMADYIAMMHPEDRPRVVGKYSAFVKSGGVDYQDEYRVLRADGGVRTISSRAKVIRDRHGRATSVSGMVWDLTEEKRQQEALQRAEERYRLATHSARVGVWIWHIAEDRFEHDDAINDLLGIPIGVRATNLEEVLAVIRPDERDRLRTSIFDALAGSAAEFFDEVRVQPADGQLRVIQSRATIYRDAAGKPLRMAGANWDATKLAQAREALEKTNRELDDFTYIASHDMKEPLRGISNYAKYLDEDHGAELSDRARSMVERIRAQAKRMETLIVELLNIARLGKVQLDVEESDLDLALRDVLASLEFGLKEKNVDLTVRALPKLRCDRVRVAELFRNLITNATKYNDKPRPVIEIGCDASGATPVFHVRDNGIGIDAKYRERVFGLFQRLHERDAFGGSTGVGLTIVKKIVEMHGGRIWIDSTPGQGSTFYFTLEPSAVT
jgi:PAS domain S-box-containing protein